MSTVLLGIAFLAAVTCAATLFSGLVFLGMAGTSALFNFGRHSANKDVAWKATAKKMMDIGIVLMVWALCSAGVAIFFGAASGRI